jgi:hypothetical protein
MPSDRRLFIGAMNYAGQGWAWARAVERELGIEAVSFSVNEINTFGFPSDQSIGQDTWRGRRDWQLEHRDYVASHFSHVIIEAFRPLFGWLFYNDPFDEAKWLEDQGVHVAMLAHGSDSRIPSRHALRTPWSPYADPEFPNLAYLERKTRMVQARLGPYSGPLFATTPDLLDDLPAATWAPVVIDAERWTTQAPVMERDVPVVLHVPSAGPAKRSDVVAEQLRPLHDAGVVEYRELRSIPAPRMRQTLEQADIVLDQFGLGSYGTAACEAMAMGRVTVGYLTDRVKRTIQDQTGGPAGVVSTEPDRLGETVRDLVADRGRAQALAKEGSHYVHKIHTGAATVHALEGFLG